MRQSKILKAKFKILGAIFFAALASSATIATTSALASWLVDGNSITVAEGMLATETEEALEFTDLGAIGTPAILCEDIVTGTVGASTQDEVTEILNLAKEKVSPSLPLSCTGIKTCTGTPTAVPINLPWSSELEGMEGEPKILDRLFGSSGKEPGYKIDCSTPIGLIEDTCEGPTSAEAENTTGNYVLVTFNPEAPIASPKIACTIGGAGSGDIKGEGLVLLTSSKTLKVTDDPVVVLTGTFKLPATKLGTPNSETILFEDRASEEVKFGEIKIEPLMGGEFDKGADTCSFKNVLSKGICEVEIVFNPLIDGESTAAFVLPYEEVISKKVSVPEYLVQASATP